MAIPVKLLPEPRPADILPSPAATVRAPLLTSAARWLTRRDPYFPVLVLLSLFALGPLLQPGYFWSAHDARHSVYFLFEFDRVFSDGVWYPRWMPDFTYGYGYPFFNIYGPGAFFVGEFLHLVGLDLVTSVKVVFGAAFVLSGMAMYAFVRHVFHSPPAALIAGLAYVYAPYHLVDVYVRANLAESVALVFLPLTLLCFYDTVVAPRPRAVVFAALSYGALLFSHNGIALFSSPVLGAWILFLLMHHCAPSPPSMRIRLLTLIRAGWQPAAAIFLGLGAAAIFFIPLVLEYKDVNVAQWTGNYYSYAEHFVDFFELFSPNWGFGISVPGPHDGLSFQLGLAPLALAFFSLFALLGARVELRRPLLFFWGLAIVTVLLMLELSHPLWDVLNLAAFAQFPWRLLTLVMLALSILAGAALLGDNPAKEAAAPPSLVALLLSAVILLSSYPYLTAQNSLEAKEGPVGLAALMNFELNANELTGITAGVKQQPSWSPLADLWVAGRKVRSKVDFTLKPESVYIGQTQNGFHANSERIAVNSPEPAQVTFNVSYYPGWKAYLLKPRSDERIGELQITPLEPYAQMQVTVPAGEYFVLLTFEDTPPRSVGKLISASALILLAGLLVLDFRTKRATPAS